jgi:hypothetical protein
MSGWYVKCGFYSTQLKFVTSYKYTNPNKLNYTGSFQKSNKPLPPTPTTRPPSAKPPDYRDRLALIARPPDLWNLKSPNAKPAPPNQIAKVQPRLPKTRCCRKPKPRDVTGSPNRPNRGSGETDARPRF